MVPELLNKVASYENTKKNNTYFKQTEIGGIPQDWDVVSIGEICNVTSGGTPSRNKPEYWDGNIPWVKTGEINYCEIKDTEEKITQEGLCNSSAKLVPRGTLLMAMYGQGVTRGKVAMLGIDAALNQACLAILQSEKICNEFLYYCLTREYQNLRGIGNETTQKNLNASIVKEVKVPLPPLLEQKKIAEILSSVDEAIASTQAVIDQTRKVKQGILQQLLTRGIGHTKFKESAIGKIPEAWKVSTIGESCIIENNLRKPINAETRAQMRGSYPYYGPTGNVDYLNEYRLEGQYVLIGEDGDHFLKYEKWSMTQLVEGQFNVNNHAHVLQGKENCSNKWLFHFFRHRNIIPHLTRQGAGRYKLNKATLCELKLAIPSLDEQKEISRILDSIDKANESYLDELNQYQKIKQGLMQDLFTGRVRVGVTP
jgi:type I restriction enzyme, S subunit